MGKKREDRAKATATGENPAYNLDGDYRSPIESYRDLSVENIKSVLLHSRYVQILLSLTVIGLFLRFFHLDYNSLWLDEATTLYESQASFGAIWQTSVTGEFHPPLFNWIVHILLTFGQSEFILRLVPAVCGVLAIPVVYMIGKEYRDRNVGLISAALLTFSYFAVFFSQEARAYSMVLLFFSLAILFYLRALRTSGISEWILFAACAAVSVWAHYYTLIGLAIVFLHAVIMLLHNEKERVQNAKFILIGAGALFILILPLALLVFDRYSKLSASAPTYGVLGPILVQETIIRFSGGYSPGALFVALIYFALMIVGLVFLFSENRNRALFSAMLLILPIIASVLLSSKITMNPRYLIYLLPVYYTTIAMCYPVIFRLIPNRNMLYAAVILIAVINAPLLAGYYSGYVKEDWRGLSGIIRSATNDGDWVVVLPGYVHQPLDYYYSNVSDHTIQSGAYMGKDLEALYQNKGNSSMYLVVTGDIQAANPGGDAVAWIDAHARPISQNTGIYFLRVA